MEAENYTAAVAVQTTAFPTDRLYSYIIPEVNVQEIMQGCRVLVPFGRSNKTIVGLVVSVRPAEWEEEQKLKRIHNFVDAAPVVTDEQLMLIHWLRENTLCRYYDAVRAVLPAALQIQVRQNYVLVPGEHDLSSLGSEAQYLLNMLQRTRSQKELDELMQGMAAEFRNELIRGGFVSLSANVKERVSKKKIRMVQLAPEQELPDSLTKRQMQIVTALQDFGTIAEKELCYICRTTSDSVQKLVKLGVIVRFEVKEQEEEPEVQRQPALTLSDEQQAVYDRAASFLETGEPKCFLLRGVTGSGKTAVFEALIDKTLSMGKSVLMLLPEIGLTPQVVNRFRSRFGNRIAVVHSGLTLRERRVSYEKALSGGADLIIGTRSAIFSPLQNLGLIIMDEEGERSYKSEAAPRYDTIQVAKQRCRYHNAVLLAASATPTLESYYYAQKGVYELLELKHRYGGAPLPAVETVNMALERQSGNDTEFSRTLHTAIQETLDKGEQCILLLNRRGYHTIISCASCNQPVYCENCSVPMTYHVTDNHLHCHFCGAAQAMPEQCPSCRGRHLRRMGFGTQRLETELELRFPDARILRMDADTTGSRYAYENSFEAFRRGEYDIMLGTQMIGKGLDFPNVTLVGVMSVDKALFTGDFRSYERTFSLIAQVVGRGGRSGKPGRAVLQTFLPDHYVLRLAAAQDYETYCRQEFDIRRALLLPPFCDICQIGFNGGTPEDTMKAAECFVSCMKEALEERNDKLPLRVLGPVPCSYSKLKGKYRYRIIIKCKNTGSFRDLIRDTLDRAYRIPDVMKVQVYADMNGSMGL